MKRSIMYLFVITVTINTVPTGGARADSEEWQAPAAAGVRAPEPTPNQASAASLDERLPPVLPGEELSDGENKIKIWSTSGPVSVSRAPDPWATAAPELGGVVVDHRKNGHGN